MLSSIMEGESEPFFGFIYAEWIYAQHISTEESCWIPSQLSITTTQERSYGVVNVTEQT